MTMYASQKINNDPSPPHVVAGYGRRNGKPVTLRGPARDDDHAIEQFDAAYPNSDPHTYGQVPRPEFGNAPNPILEAFRIALRHSVSGSTMPEVAAEWLETDMSTMRSPVEWGHILHARKVLARLAELSTTTTTSTT